MKIFDEEYMGTLVDLPCIIEGQKTLDHKTFFKSGDISQMIYVHPKTSIPPHTFNPFIHGFVSFFIISISDPEFAKMQYTRTKEEKYCCRSGLTPPTFNVKELRFKRR